MNDIEVNLTEAQSDWVRWATEKAGGLLPNVQVRGNKVFVPDRDSIINNLEVFLTEKAEKEADHPMEAKAAENAFIEITNRRTYFD